MSQANYTTTGQRLEELRIGLRNPDGSPLFPSKEAFAGRISVTRQAYEGWLTGKHKIRGDNLVSIAERFGVTVGWVLGIKGEPKYRNEGIAPPDLEAAVANHVAREVPQRVPRSTYSQFDFRGYVYDGGLVLELAVQREAARIVAARAASDAYAERAREVLHQMPRQDQSVFAGVDLEWPKPGESREQTRTRARLHERRIALFLIRAVQTYRGIEFARLLTEPGGAMVHRPSEPKA